MIGWNQGKVMLRSEYFLHYIYMICKMPRLLLRRPKGKADGIKLSVTIKEGYSY